MRSARWSLTILPNSLEFSLGAGLVNLSYCNVRGSPREVKERNVRHTSTYPRLFYIVLTGL